MITGMQVTHSRAKILGWAEIR